MFDSWLYTYYVYSLQVQVSMQSFITQVMAMNLKVKIIYCRLMQRPQILTKPSERKSFSKRCRSAMHWWISCFWIAAEHGWFNYAILQLIVFPPFVLPCYVFHAVSFPTPLCDSTFWFLSLVTSKVFLGHWCAIATSDNWSGFVDLERSWLSVPKVITL